MKLSRRASGGRHLRWLREIIATMEAHLAHNDLLSPAQRELLTRERDAARAHLEALAASVAAYRSWLETAHTGLRAELRVANFLADDAQTKGEAAVRPHRADVARVLPGGISRILSGLPLSRVLTAGNERTAKLARAAADGLTLLASGTTISGLPELAARLVAAADRIDALLKRNSDEIEPQRRPLRSAVERGVLELREGLEKMDARLRDQFSVSFIASLYPELSRSGTAVADEPDDDDDDTEPPADEPVS